MKQSILQAVAIQLALFALFLQAATARVFTDDQGRTTEAELAGVVKDEVILRKRGVAIRWPIAKLSGADQTYVKKWQASPPSTPRLLVRLWEKKGFSSAGTFSEQSDQMPGLPNIPGILEIEKKETFYYFDVDVSNPGKIQANHLSLVYQLYVINAAGSVVVEAGSAVVPAVNAQQRVSSPTKAISSTRTKTTTLSLSSNAAGGISTGQNKSRSSERFGGGWARVYAHDGSVIGEDRDLHPEIERLKPAWIAPTTAYAPKLESLGEFDGFVEKVQEKLKKIQELLKTLPPPPGTGKGLPKKPPFPPGKGKPKKLPF